MFIKYHISFYETSYFWCSFFYWNLKFSKFIVLDDSQNGALNWHVAVMPFTVIRSVFFCQCLVCPHTANPKRNIHKQQSTKHNNWIKMIRNKLVFSFGLNHRYICNFNRMWWCCRQINAIYRLWSPATIKRWFFFARTFHSLQKFEDFDKKTTWIFANSVCANLVLVTTSRLRLCASFGQVHCWHTKSIVTIGIGHWIAKKFICFFRLNVKLRCLILQEWSKRVINFQTQIKSTSMKM